MTTFRRDGTYSDHRRPDDVTFGDTLDEDLARRDFTVNAMAIPLDADGMPGAVVDRFDGRADLAAGVLRAVGDPGARFREDALRMLRAVRFAATLGFTVEPATRAAIAAEAPLAVHVSGERTFVELMRLLAAERPSTGLRLAEETGLLAVVAPELARQRGIPQAKIPGDDLWDHTWRTVDAAAPTLVDGPPARPRPRRCSTTSASRRRSPTAISSATRRSGRSSRRRGSTGSGRRAPSPRGWPASSATTCSRMPRSGRTRRSGASSGGSAWSTSTSCWTCAPPTTSGAACRANVDGLDELRERCRAQVAAHVALERGDLAVDGDDLMRALALAPGPAVGRLLDELLERVLADPMLNERGRLLAIAREVGPRRADGASRGAAPAIGARAGRVAATGEPRP